jgi:ATP-dependent DNA helicase RecG
VIKLETPLNSLPFIRPTFEKKLYCLGLKTVRDLLWHFPNYWEDFSKIYKIIDLEPGQQATISATVDRVRSRQSWYRRRLNIAEATLSDETGSIKANWFNQPYIVSALHIGQKANFSGKVTLSKDGELRLSHPTYELISEFHPSYHTARIVPVYPETRGLTSKGIRYFIQNIFKNLETIPETIPLKILNEGQFPEINTALRQIHFPENLEEALSAKRRFSFEELFLLQLFNLKQKLKISQESAVPLKINVEELKRLIKKLPFELTFSQKRSLWEIIQDLEKNHPMNRLLQGDVGSGKTVVAALAALIAAYNGYQAAFLAPTEILAKQHFEALKKLFLTLDQKINPPTFWRDNDSRQKNYILPSTTPLLATGHSKGRRINICLLTSNLAKIFYENDLETNIKKSELLKKISDGEIQIVVGTHSLISAHLGKRNVVFKNLALAIVDEQHRFGVRQRAALLRNPNTKNTPEFPKNEPKNKIIEKELSYKLNDIAFSIQKELGRHCQERQYSDILEQKLTEQKIPFRREQAIEIAGRKSNFADFIIANKIIIEVKAKPFIKKEDYYQIMRYLKTSKLELGLIVNFHQEYLKPKRVLNPALNSGHSNDKFSDCVLAPHFLSMSATPIPRTLNLTVFGDLDLSTIDEMPKGRMPVITKIVSPEERAKTYEFIRQKIKEGRQAFVVCPRIEPPTKDEAALTPKIYRAKEIALEIKSVKQEYEKLSKKIFPDLKIEMLHGKIKSDKKEKIMSEFLNKKTDILVSTSVIEVGIDIPNAAIIMIEGSDRFGLAQLYQLRGRVGRGESQSYCFLFTDSDSVNTKKRLKAILEAKNGFELAEQDLKMRGPGEIFGTKQTGIPDLAMKALQNPDLVKLSREKALQIISASPSMAKYPSLKKAVSSFEAAAHLE